MSTRKNLSRRQFIDHVGAGSVGIVCGGALANQLLGCSGDNNETQNPPTENQQPNILLVTTDQEHEPRWFRHDADWWAKQLPGRAWLKRHGVSFTNAHCVTLPCSPSRASIFTGLYPHQHQIYGNCGFDGNYLASFPTSARVLREKYDYATYFIGKSHLAAMQKFDCAQDKKKGHDVYGFDEWVTQPTGPFLPTDQWPDKVCYDSPGIPTEGTHEDEEFTKAATAWLAQRGKEAEEKAKNSKTPKPWFAALNLVNPHDVCWYPRYTLPEAKNDPFAIKQRPGNWESKDELEKRKPTCQREYVTFYSTAAGGVIPESGPEADEKWVGLINYYLQLQQRSDAHLVELIKAILALPPAVRDNLVLFFTADHGEQLGAHGQRGKGPSMYEEQMNVPLYVVDFSALKQIKTFSADAKDESVVAGRYVEKPGSSRAQLVCHHDMRSTIVTIGANLPQTSREEWRNFKPFTVKKNGREDVVCGSQIHGQNLEPLLTTSGADKHPRDYLLASHDWFISPAGQGPVAVTTNYHIVSLRKQKRSSAGALNSDLKLNLNYNWRKKRDPIKEKLIEETDSAGNGFRAEVDWEADLHEVELYDMQESKQDVLEVNNLLPADLPDQLRSKKPQGAKDLVTWAKANSLGQHTKELEEIAKALFWPQKVSSAGGHSARTLSDYSLAQKVAALTAYASLKQELIDDKIPHELRRKLPDELHPIQVQAWKHYRDGEGKGECDDLDVGSRKYTCVGL